MNSAGKNFLRVIIAMIVISVIFFLSGKISPVSQFVVGFCGGALTMILFILLDKI